MKANKIFAAALAALTLVGFSACKDNKNVEALSIDPTSVKLKVGEEATITATVAATWASKDETVATVTPGNDGGKTAKVKALAEGTSIISATTAAGEIKTCLVTVEKDGQQGGGGEAATITAKRIWPVILDEETANVYANLIAGDFRVNDVDNFLYIWASGETYNGGEATGKNYFGRDGYIALTVAAPAGWSGLGFCIENSDAIVAAQQLKEAIVANPDNFFFHIALKSTNEGNHEFYTFGTDATAFNIGAAVVEKGVLVGDFTRDGAWYGFDIPMAQFAQAIATADVKSGINMLCALSGGTVGAQLNMDAAYFYEKQ